MAEIGAAILNWLIPAAVVFGVTAIAIAVVIWAVRRARRSPRARATAEEARTGAGGALVALDDAVNELEMEVGFSGALFGAGAPASLRRARLAAGHVRDESFEEFAEISEDNVHPVQVRRGAARISKRVEDAMDKIAKARTELAEWVGTHMSAGDQVAAARARLEAIRAEMGEPEALISALRVRYDPDEWQEAAQAARGAAFYLEECQRHLTDAESRLSDPSRSVLNDIAAAERTLRRAEHDTRALEETYRLVTEAAQALPGEVEAAQAALRQATAMREHLEPDDADRLGEQVAELSTALDALLPGAARRPTRTVDRIARIRDRLDMALGDARTAQQRIRGARTALPGTLASARSAIARADAAVAVVRAGADARSRLVSAQRELAAARQAPDPVAALDAARRAFRYAEDALALVDYARLSAD